MSDSRLHARSPIASVVIPAHDEEHKIAACLSSLLRDARPGEFEVCVAANGCTDRTVEIARGFDGVEVLDLRESGKIVALNAGDAACSAFPRVYLDADVEMSTESLRAVVGRLGEPGVLAAAPKMHVDLTESSRPLRMYFSVWNQLAWMKDSMIGSGVYALSQEGRRRFDRFPDVYADDYWISAQFTDDERSSVDGATFSVVGAPNLRIQVRRQARILAYNRLIADEVRAAQGTVPAKGQGLLDVVREQPRSLPSVVVYTVSAVVSNVWALVKVRTGSLRWISDR